MGSNNFESNISNLYSNDYNSNVLINSNIDNYHSKVINDINQLN
jgi:hypothetical protein